MTGQLHSQCQDINTNEEMNTPAHCQIVQSSVSILLIVLSFRFICQICVKLIAQVNSKGTNDRKQN